MQRLRGPGFSSIPSAVDQGALAPATLQRRRADVGQPAARRRRERRPRAGARHRARRLRLATRRSATSTASTATPRQRSPAMASRSREGLAAAGVDATVKHFPGLGRVTGNTDTTSGVTDTVTTRDRSLPGAVRRRRSQAGVAVRDDVDGDLQPHRPGHPAAFSTAIVTGMLRGDSASAAWSSATTSARRTGRRLLAPAAARSTSSGPAATSCSPSTQPGRRR